MRFVKRELLPDGNFIDWSFTQIEPDQWRPHGYKYRVAWIQNGVCRVLFDNHHGKLEESMKVRKIQIEFRKPGEKIMADFVRVGNEIAERVKKGLPPLKEEEEVFVVSFPNLEVFSKVFTPARLEILRVVKEHKPESLNELARLVGRDYPNVHADVKYLAQHDFLVLERKPGRGRGTVKPKFEWDGLEIRF